MDTSNPLLRRTDAFSLSGEEVRTMTFPGMVNKTGILLLLCFVTGIISWSQPELRGILIPVGLIGGLIACMVGMFKPASTPISAPIYAVMEGLCLGALSQMFNQRYPGIAVNALLLTFGVLAIMLVLYTNRIIRVTDRLTKGIMVATGAICLLYFVNMIMNLFGANMPYLHDSGPVGIGISLVIVGIAAFNLLLDFAVIETSVRRRAPAYMEWYCGMALLVTLVWLYLEILRLLSKMNRR